MIVTRNPLHVSESPCLICFESTSQTHTFSCKCKGSFHNACLQTWFSVNSYECPLCRRSLASGQPLHSASPPHIHITIQRDPSRELPIITIYRLLFQENISYMEKVIILIKILIAFILIGFALFIPGCILYLLATNKNL